MWRDGQCRGVGSSSDDDGRSGDEWSSAAFSPGIECCSLIQAPKSINRQRSLQNGRHFDAADHSTGLLQVGQAKVGMRGFCRR